MKKLLTLSWALLLTGIVCLYIDVPRAQVNLPLMGVGGGGGVPTWGNFAAASTVCSFVTTCQITTTMPVTTGMVVAVAGANNQSGSSGTITGINVCNTALTVDSSNTIPSSDMGAAIGHGQVTGNANCTVTVTFSVAGSLNSAGVALGTITNLNSSTPGTACGSQFPVSQNSPFQCPSGLTVSAGGFGISGFWNSTATLPSSGDAVLTVDATASNTGPPANAIAIGHTTASFTTQTIWAASNFCNCGDIGEPFR